MLYKNQLANEDLASQSDLTISPAIYADMTFHAYGERLSDDYTYILKKVVVPGLPGLGSLKLRELRILASLSVMDTPLSPIQVSELLSYDPATVTRASVKLVGERKITRSANNLDTRNILLILTNEGKALANSYLSRLRHVFETLEEGLFAKMGEEDKIQLITMMAEVNKRSAALRSLCDKRTWEFPGE
mgnify:CR=1 FL=1